jgi:(p)ppGpp synthase/HD superfamily hydrolase
MSTSGTAAPLLETPLSDAFAQALQLAFRLHARQARKGTHTPYVAHLLAVASLVLEQGGTENEAIAALLHDAVEDQGGMATAREIERCFGQEVLDIVLGCSDCIDPPKPPWQIRKTAYLVKLRSASPSVHLVSLCDKMHNARSLLRDYRAIGEPLWSRFNGGKDGTLWYYRELIQAYRERGPSPLLVELEDVVGEIERLAAAMR